MQEAIYTHTLLLGQQHDCTLPVYSCGQYSLYMNMLAILYMNISLVLLSNRLTIEVMELKLIGSHNVTACCVQVVSNIVMSLQ